MAAKAAASAAEASVRAAEAAADAARAAEEAADAEEEHSSPAVLCSPPPCPQSKSRSPARSAFWLADEENTDGRQECNGSPNQTDNILSSGSLLTVAAAGERGGHDEKGGCATGTKHLGQVEGAGAKRERAEANGGIGEEDMLKKARDQVGRFCCTWQAGGGLPTIFALWLMATL